jgi:hypothetical protein
VARKVMEAQSSQDPVMLPLVVSHLRGMQEVRLAMAAQSSQDLVMPPLVVSHLRGMQEVRLAMAAQSSQDLVMPLLVVLHLRGMQEVSPAMVAQSSQDLVALPLVVSHLQGMQGGSLAMVAQSSQDPAMPPLVALQCLAKLVSADLDNKADRIVRMAAQDFRDRPTKNRGTGIMHHMPVLPVVDLICKPEAPTATWAIKRTTSQCLLALWQLV